MEDRLSGSRQSGGGDKPSSRNLRLSSKPLNGVAALKDCAPTWCPGTAFVDRFSGGVSDSKAIVSVDDL